MATNSPPQDLAMTDNQTPPSIPTEEPKYGGFTRFEIELEVRYTASAEASCILVNPNFVHLTQPLPVRPIPCLTLLSQPSRRTEILRATWLRRLSTIPAILVPLTILEVSSVSRAHAEESRIVAAGEI
jgi:hypothetical protein